MSLAHRKTSIGVRLLSVLLRNFRCAFASSTCGVFACADSPEA